MPNAISPSPSLSRSATKAEIGPEPAAYLTYAANVPSPLFSRIDILLDRLGPHPKSSRSTGYAEIKACIRSLVKQSLSPYSPSYLKTMKHALRYHWKILPKAFHQSICAEHFIKMTKYALKADEIKKDFMEKVKDYQTQISHALEIRLSEGRKRIAQIQCDVNEFLKRTRKKIRKLPEEYRNILMKAYLKAADSIQMRFKTSLVYAK